MAVVIDINDANILCNKLSEDYTFEQLATKLSFFMMMKYNGDLEACMKYLDEFESMKNQLTNK